MKKILILLIFSAMTYVSLFAEATTNGLLCNEEAEMANINVADFKIAINCNDGNWSATATAKITTATNHIWELWSTTVAGAISGGTLVSTITGGLSATFGWLDLSKHYYIVHYSEISGNPVATRLAVPDFSANASLAYVFKNKEGVVKDNFCFGEDIFLDPSGTSNYDRYFMSVWRRPSGSNANFALYADYGWTYSNNIGTLNLSKLVRTSGENPGEIFEPGYVYQLQFAIANPPNCIPWIELKREFRVECCAGFISGAFELFQESWYLKVDNFETYDNIGATHSWVILSNPEQESGSFSNYGYVGETITTEPGPQIVALNISHLSQPYYTVIHRVSTLCGDYCYGQQIRSSYLREDSELSKRSGDDCELCGPNACDFLDNECFGTGFLTMYWEQGASFKIVWVPVPGVTDYLVEISYNQGPCCEDSSGEQWVDTYHTTNSYIYPDITWGNCFSIRVVTICDEMEIWSEYACDESHLTTPPGSETKHGSGRTTGKDLSLPMLYPNPANEQLSVQLPKGAIVETIRLLDMQGRVVFTKQQPDQQFEIDCKALPAGMYTIRITYADQSQAIQKVQIIHP